jgi:transposase
MLFGMQGKHEYQPELFSTVEIEKLIPKNHLLRRIDRVLDLRFIHELTAPLYCHDHGRKSIDPEVFFRMVLLQALYNINSDRQLCEEVGFNLAYRWFCRLSLQDEVPEHSSMTRVRDRLGEKVYEQVFQQVLGQCRKAGLVKAEQIMIDGSHIKANASIYGMVERNPKKDDDDQDNEPPSPTQNREQIHSKDGLSNSDLRKRTIKGEKISNKTHVSPVDPDATLSGKAGETKSLQYKTHHAIDADSRVILDCPVTTGSVSDVTMMQTQIERLETKLDLKIGEIIADRGYGSEENLTYLEQKGIASNIPLWSSNSGKTIFKELEAGFQIENWQVTCPEGHVMKRTTREHGRELHVLPRSICIACPRWESCVTESDRKVRGKRFSLVLGHRIFMKILEQSKTREFKQKLWQRMWKMEGIFAEAKSHHGLRRARYRGLWKMQSQVYVIATVQNLKRLAAVALFALKSIWIDLARNSRIPIFLENSHVFA